jgi:hypothetical protein
MTHICDTCRSWTEDAPGDVMGWCALWENPTHCSHTCEQWTAPEAPSTPVPRSSRARAGP